MLDLFNFTTVYQLDQITTDLNEKPVIIFKHSTRCGISKMVLKRFQNSIKDIKDKFDIYLLDLLEYRQLSNEIASRLEIEHQSPQAIVLKNNAVVTSASHYDILEINFEKFL